LNEANIIPAQAQGFDDAVDAISGEAEDELNLPIDQRVDENVCGVWHYG